jgi:hypothetical protein
MPFAIHTHVHMQKKSIVFRGIQCYSAEYNICFLKNTQVHMSMYMLICVSMCIYQYVLYVSVSIVCILMHLYVFVGPLT